MHLFYQINSVFVLNFVSKDDSICAYGSRLVKLCFNAVFLKYFIVVNCFNFSVQRNLPFVPPLHMLCPGVKWRLADVLRQFMSLSIISLVSLQWFV
jgi:hypothetical protein